MPVQLQRFQIRIVGEKSSAPKLVMIWRVEVNDEKRIGKNSVGVTNNTMWDYLRLGRYWDAGEQLEFVGSRDTFWLGDKIFGGEACRWDIHRR